MHGWMQVSLVKVLPQNKGGQCGNDRRASRILLRCAWGNLKSGHGFEQGLIFHQQVITSFEQVLLNEEA
jgi:hypothetical protein